MVNKQPFDDTFESEEPDVEGHGSIVDGDNVDDAKGPASTVGQ